MKQLLLPLTTATIVGVTVSGCAANNKTPNDLPTPVLQHNHAQAFNVEMKEHGQVVANHPVPSKADSTVNRSPKKTPSNAPIGKEWYRNKDSLSDTTIERSFVVTNQRIGVAHARLAGLDGTGVTVAVADTGIYNKDNFNDKHIDVVSHEGLETYDHGDVVANILAGKHDGVAPNANLVDARHSATTLTTSKALINASKVAPIINYSGTMSLVAADTPTAKKSSQTAKNTYDKVVIDNKALVITTTGNDGWNEPTADVLAVLDNPELQKGVIYVTGTNSGKDTQLGTESNGQVWANRCGMAADFCLATSGFFTTPHGQTARVRGGTSFAAPRVAGAAALIKQKYPWASNDVLRTTILTTATDLGDKNKYGWGMLDIAKAINGPSQLAFGELKTDVSPGVYEFSNDISGSGSLLKTGLGTLNIDGLATYKGGSTVQAGVLNINNGHTGQVTIKGGELGGEGLVHSVNNEKGVLNLENGLGVYQLFLGKDSTTKIKAGTTSTVYGNASLNGRLSVSSQSNEHKQAPQNTQTLLKFNQGYAGKFTNLSSALAYDVTADYQPTQINVNLTRKNASQLTSLIDTTTTDENSFYQAAKNAHYLADVDTKVLGQDLKTRLHTLYSTNDEQTYTNSLYGLGTSVLANTISHNTLDALSVAGNTNKQLLEQGLQKNNEQRHSGISALYAYQYKHQDHHTSNVSAKHISNHHSVGVGFHNGDDLVGSASISQGQSDWTESLSGQDDGVIKTKTTGLHLSAVKQLGGGLTINGDLSGLNIRNDVLAAHSVIGHHNKASVLSLGAGVKKQLQNPWATIAVNAGVRVENTKLKTVNTKDGQDYLALTGMDKSTTTPVLAAGAVVSKQLPYLNGSEVQFLGSVEYDTKDRMDNLGAWKSEPLRAKIGLNGVLNKKGLFSTSFGLEHGFSQSDKSINGAISIRY